MFFPVNRIAAICTVLLLSVVVTGCNALREIANLRQLEFWLDQVADIELADVEMDRIRDYEDLRAWDVARLAAAVADRNVPLSFVLDIGADNPEENGVQARMVQLEWTLLLEDRETISGTLVEEYVIPSGDSVTIPLAIELELLSFFDDNARDLVDLVLSLSGAGGAPTNIKVRATPTVNTPVGPIRYPNPVTIVSKTVG